MKCLRVMLPAVFTCAVLSRATGQMPDFSGPPRQFEIVRQALRDELWSIAARRADAAAKDKKLETDAHLAKLEALAAEGRYADMLKQLDDWNSSGEIFRYWRGWTLARLGRAEDARQALSGEFTDAEVNALKFRLLARIDADQGRRKAAEDNFRLAAVVVASNDTLRAENAVEWAQMLADAGDAAAAIAVLKSEKTLDVPGTAGDFARAQMAGLLAGTGRAEEANAIRRNLVAAGTNTDERVFVTTACALSQDAKEKSQKIEYAELAVARARRPELRREAGYLLGFLELEDKKKRADGMARIKDLIKEFTDTEDSRTAALSLADRLLAIGEPESAAEEYRIFLEMYPDVAVSGDAHVLEGRGWAQLALGRRAEAIGTFARAAQVATNQTVKVRCRFKQGEALVAEGRFDEAAAIFGQIAADGGELSARARYNLADALERSGKGEEAEKEFRDIVKQGGAHAAEAELRLARREAASGRFEQSIETYGKLLKREGLTMSLKEQALVGRGRACYRAYRFKDAAADFERAAAIAPGRRDEMRFLMALCSYGDGRDVEAKGAVVNLLAEAKDERLRADLVLWLAKYDANRGNWVAAESGFEDFARNNTNRPLQAADALVQAARAAGARSDYAKAVELVSQAVKTAPDAPFLADALIVQGEALMVLARYDDAVLVLDRALLASPGETVSRRAGMLKADALFAMGADNGARYKEALASYRALSADVGLTPSARLEIAFKIGRTLEKLRRSDEAADQYYSNVVLAYEHARRKGEWFDDSARAFFARAAFALADHYEAKGLDRQARRVLQHVARSDVPAADEARKRIDRLETKGRIL